MLRDFRIQLASFVCYTDDCAMYVRFDVCALFLTSFGCHFGRQKLQCKTSKRSSIFPSSLLGYIYSFLSFHFISFRFIQMTFICQKLQSASGRFTIHSLYSSEPTTRWKRSLRPIAEQRISSTASVTACIAPKLSRAAISFLGMGTSSKCENALLQR